MEEQDLIIEAFEELSPRYEQVVDSELNLFWGWRYATFIRTLLQSTPISADDRILDIATGTGMIPTALSSEVDLLQPLHGLDITYGMLRRARENFSQDHPPECLTLTCATALAMPYRRGSFSLIFCGLATHHMHVPTLLAEMHRILADGGRIAVADVGSSPLWRIPGIRLLLRTGAFLFFLFRENFQRAWAEALAVSNIRTSEEWVALLKEAGFDSIAIELLPSKYRWIPDPLVMHAKKTRREK
jgi:ubiquinone/menaquinone biosynthesis C-methylase UbiE